MTNPVTPSPDPWEVLRELIVVGIDCECLRPGHEDDCTEGLALAALTTLRTQAERQEAALREIAGPSEWSDWRDLREIALAALSPTEEPTGEFGSHREDDEYRERMQATEEPTKRVVDLNGDPISDNPPWGATGGYGRVVTEEPTKVRVSDLQTITLEPTKDERCPTCGSDDPKVFLGSCHDRRWTLLDPSKPNPDPWHTKDKTP